LGRGLAGWRLLLRAVLGVQRIDCRCPLFDGLRDVVRIVRELGERLLIDDDVNHS
jgi:hypothetical protein